MVYDPGDRSDVRHPLHPLNEESDSIYGCGAKLIIGLILLLIVVAAVGLVIEFWRYWAIPITVGLVLLPVLAFLINKRKQMSLPEPHSIYHQSEQYTSIKNPWNVKFFVLIGVIALLLYSGCEIAATTETFHWLNDGLGMWKCDGVPQGISSDKWFDC